MTKVFVTNGACRDRIIERNNAIKMSIIYGNDAVAADPDKLRSQIDYHTDETSKYGLLDVEQPLLSLMSTRDPAGVDLSQGLLETAKQHRPDMIWGHYGIPATKWWNESHDAEQEKLSREALANADFVAPSIHPRWREARTQIKSPWTYAQTIQRELGWYQRTLDIAKRIADDRPLYPVSTNRWSWDTGAGQLVQVERLRLKYLKMCMWSGADGLIFWSADRTRIQQESPRLNVIWWTANDLKWLERETDSIRAGTRHIERVADQYIKQFVRASVQYGPEDRP